MTVATPAAEEQVTNYDLSREAEQRIKDLEQELQFTRENLQASIEELETSNEELQATNEELLASNEELQSTNEELQSVNEELFTVNAEHQNKITELMQANNDLDNYVSSTDAISVFLDENLDIRRFTSNAKQVFNILDLDIGRPFEHISHRMNDVDIHMLINKVVNNEGVQKLQVFVPDQGWFLLRVRPYMVSEQTQSGIVLVLNNIDEIKELQTSLSDTRGHFEDVLNTAGIGVWEWNLSDNSMQCSDVVESILGFVKGDCDGSYTQFIEQVHPDDRDKVTQTYKTAINSLSSFTVSHRIRPQNGEESVLINQTGLVEIDESGKPNKVLGIVRLGNSQSETADL